ncbi:MAG: DNA repair protein RadC [Chloroflexi bacterium]|nr:DNA repair protein RadC [Chloroflexota bacterium]
MEYHVGLKDLPASVRPRERLLHHGAGALSNSELLALVLRTGSATCNVLELANQLLARFGTGEDGPAALAQLAEASIGELSRQPGIGPAKAMELKAAFELGRRLVSLNPGDRPQVRSPQDVANLLLAEMGALDQEHLRTVLLNTKNRVLGVHDVYRGSLNTSLVRVGEVFREPIRNNCAAIILVHNHPSGDPTPSPEDVRLTQQVVEAGQLLDVEVLDHLVIGRPGFVSLRERGLGFAKR